jgi:hypothetical protein
MYFHFSKHVFSDIRYRKTCALTLHFVLGVGGGRMPCKLPKIFLRAVDSPGRKKKTFSAPEKYEKKMGGKKKIVPTPTQKNGACAENITQ